MCVCVCRIFHLSLHLFFFLLYSGCACRFLYGPETKDEHKSQIEKSLDGKLELKLEVIFYKKNGKCAKKDLYQINRF